MTDLQLLIHLVSQTFSMFGFIIRFHQMGKIRAHFVADESIPASMYSRLPTIMSMTYNPMHWHRWTKRQWVKYVESLEGVK